jgi:hypothetical protein
MHAEKLPHPPAELRATLRVRVRCCPTPCLASAREVLRSTVQPSSATRTVLEPAQETAPTVERTVGAGVGVIAYMENAEHEL